MTRLIITNGDSAAALLAEAGRSGTILPWRDVLYEGPIVGGAIEACSSVRAGFLAARFGIDLAEVVGEFAARDAAMRAHADFDRIELWFEHDLYDQLQLIQILSFFADEGRTEGIDLIQADDFLGAERPDTILRFARGARAIIGTDLDYADFVWADLAMPTPEALMRRLDEPFPALRFVGPALHRFLEELPSPVNGLGRTEAAALSELATGPRSAVELFRSTLTAEEAAFMGDASLFLILRDLAEVETPLITGLPLAGEVVAAGDPGKRPLGLTEAGAAVLAGESDNVRLNGVDRWWAGTRLKGRTSWRYDRDVMTLVSPQASAA